MPSSRQWNVRDYDKKIVHTITKNQLEEQIRAYDVMALFYRLIQCEHKYDDIKSDEAFPGPGNP